MNISNVNGHLVGSVIDVNMDDIERLVINDLCPDVHYSTRNPSFFFLKVHIMEVDVSMQLLVRYGIHDIFLFVKFNIIIIDINVIGPDLHRKAFTIFHIVFDEKCVKPRVLDLISKRDFIFYFH